MTTKRRPTGGSKTRTRTPAAPATSDPPAADPADPPVIVGVGASAGGLEAFTELLRALPHDSGLAYVLVQHLDPAHESLLAELLGRVAPFPVVEATDGMAVVINRAYVIPPATTMVLEDGHLRLAPRGTSRQPARSIDAFFRSLADAAGSRAIGVVLSGVASDGAAGLEAIKAAGGMTFAQDPASARFDGMPSAAIATRCTDFVLAPADIAARLAHVGRHPYAQPFQGLAPDADPLAPVLQLLRRRCGVDFALYKEGTVRRRLLRRMVLHGIDTLPAYLDLLEADRAEVDALHSDLLIGVTRFFRDPAAFAALSESAFPELLARRSPGAPIRIWVAGCATGEEAYSIAMCLLEFLTERRETVSIQLFATDLSDAAISTARSGRYLARIEHDVSPARLREFFVKEEHGYRIAQRIRDLCVFARQNVADDPPFSQLDMVSCRNLLIYLQPSAHPRIFAIFHYALKPEGILALGSSETVALAPTLFRPIDAKHRIYARIAGTVRPPVLGITGAGRPRAVGWEAGDGRARRSGAGDVQRAADELVLAAYAPAGVIVDDGFRVVQFRGRTTEFLAPASGAASLDLLRMVRPATQTILRKAFRTARARRAPVHVKGVRARGTNDRRRPTSLRVIPFTLGPAATQYFVVLFEGPATSKATEAGADALTKGQRAKRTPPVSKQPRTVSELREELDATRESLQAIAAEQQGFVEELQIASEEAQSSSEEFQSANEELQSTNEELETAKEELQSTNEELTTVNDELRSRMTELVRLNDDLNNVLGIIHVPLIIVDRDLRIRRFTAGAERLMNLMPADVGRPIGDMRSNQDVPDLEQIIRTVMRTLKPEEREVRDSDGRWFSVTIRPYATGDQSVDGAVIIYQDIDLMHRHVLELDAARLTADVANRAKSLFLTTMSHELRTPLNAISGYAALMADGIRGPITAEQTGDLSRIRGAGTHLMGLINDILNYAKLESAQVRFTAESVPLDETLGQAVTMLAPQAQAKGIGLEHVQCDPLATARGDREKLMQIVLNLLSNAVKFTDTGGRIVLACDATEDPVRLWVRDTGRGIAANQLEKVFEPFVQVGRTLAGPDAGVGLGLSISRDLARAMGGDLTAESVEHVGSTFVLTLPRGTPATKPASQRGASSAQGGGAD